MYIHCIKLLLTLVKQYNFFRVDISSIWYNFKMHFPLISFIKSCMFMHCFISFNIEILLELPAVLLVIHLCFELFCFYFLIHLVLNQSWTLKLNTFTIAWIWRASCLKRLSIDLIFILCIRIHSFTICCNIFTGYFYMICLVSLYFTPTQWVLN